MTDVLVERETLVLVEASDGGVLLEQPARAIEIVTEGLQGPPGPRGNPGPTGGSTLVRVSTPISGHSAVACNWVGELIPADCTIAAHRGVVLGVVTQAHVPGDEAAVKTGFPIEHLGWTWSTGPVYVGMAGQLTQTLPVGAQFSQVVGVALSPTLVLVDLQPPITIA